MFWRVVMLVNVLIELKSAHRWTDWNLSTFSPGVARRKVLFSLSNKRLKIKPMHKWSESLHFVQTLKNRTCHRGTKNSRCKAMLYCR